MLVSLRRVYFSWIMLSQTRNHRSHYIATFLIKSLVAARSYSWCDRSLASNEKVESFVFRNSRRQAHKGFAAASKCRQHLVRGSHINTCIRHPCEVPCMQNHARTKVLTQDAEQWRPEGVEALPGVVRNDKLLVVSGVREEMAFGDLLDR